MKLGLAEKHDPRPPAILVLGDGAQASQIQNDLQKLGLHAIFVGELGMGFEEQSIPKVTDPDARTKLQRIFHSFKNMDTKSPFDHTWVHPGLTVWGERSEFESWARQVGLSAIVSPAKVLHLFWNTFQLMEVARQLNVPTLVLTDDPITSIREIESAIKKLFQNQQATLPFVLKSAYRVRNGYGHRVVRQMEDLAEWVPIWMNHVHENSGQVLLMIERYLESARSYVQPFARLKNGDIEFFPLVDASLTFEGKNWVEVCPAQNMDDYIQEKIETNTRKIIEHSDFVGVGSLVFLSNGVEVYLTEGLARPNFAYRLWETVGRTKALKWQLHALAPGLLVQQPKSRSRIRSTAPICGLELKLFAEDTALKIPSPGTIYEVSQKTNWNEGGFEAELIFDVVPGQNMDWKATGSLGSVNIFAESWPNVFHAAKNVLSEIWVSGGIQTNERFLFELLSHPWIEESMFYTGFVDEEFIPKQVPDVHWLQAMADALSEMTEPLNEQESWLWMNHRLPPPSGPLKWTQKVIFQEQGHSGIQGYFKSDQGTVEKICIFPVTRTRFVIRIRNWFFSIRRSEKGKPLQLMALTTGRVHSIFFKEGSVIQPKQCVLIIESQQSLISHRLPIAVTLKSLKVRAEDEVVVGQELAELERWSDHQESKS